MRLFYEDYDKNKTGFRIDVMKSLSDWLISLTNKHQLENLSKPVNVAYVTPSVTTWIGMDPSFRPIFNLTLIGWTSVNWEPIRSLHLRIMIRIYEIDHWDNNDSTFAGEIWCGAPNNSNIFLVLDHHTFTADVEIPKSENLKFKKEYSARSEYRLNDLRYYIYTKWPRYDLCMTLYLSVKSWANLISQWERGENLRLLQRYYLNKYHHNLNEECDSKCIIDTICFIKSAAKDDHLYKTLCSAELWIKKSSLTGLSPKLLCHQHRFRITGESLNL